MVIACTAKDRVIRSPAAQDVVPALARDAQRDSGLARVQGVVAVTAEEHNFAQGVVRRQSLEADKRQAVVASAAQGSDSVDSVQREARDVPHAIRQQPRSLVCPIDHARHDNKVAHAVVSQGEVLAAVHRGRVLVGTRIGGIESSVGEFAHVDTQFGTHVVGHDRRTQEFDARSIDRLVNPRDGKGIDGKHFDAKNFHLDLEEPSQRACDIPDAVEIARAVALELVCLAF